MTRNTFFAAMVFGMMAMTTTTMNAQGHGHNNKADNGRGYTIEATHNDGRGNDKNYRVDDRRDKGNGGYANTANKYDKYGNKGGYANGKNDKYDKYGNKGGYANGKNDKNYDYDKSHYNYYANGHNYGHNNYREMNGHRWDNDGWMEGYHGRVRYFDDGRWGYLRDGRWYYYTCFYEPDYYYARPLNYFDAYTYTKAEKAAIGATVGVVAVAALIAALVN